MKDFSILKQRILQILEYKGITKYEFYQKSGVSNSVLSQKSGLSEENLFKTLSMFRNLNYDWFFFGNGQMFHDDEIKQPSSVNKDETEKLGTAEPLTMYVADKELLTSKNETISILKNSLDEANKNNEVFRNLIASKIFNKL